MYPAQTSRVNIFPKEREYFKLALEYEAIPVYTEINSGIFTPSEIFEIFREDSYESLLESSRINKVTGKYSFIGLDVRFVFKAYGNKVELKQGGTTKISYENPWSSLKSIFSKHKGYKNPYLPRFSGGAIGFLKYESLKFFENIILESKGEDNLNIPDIFLVFYDTVIAFNHLARKIFIISNAYSSEGFCSYEKAVRRVKSIASRIHSKPPKEKDFLKFKARGVKAGRQFFDFKSSFSESGFKEAVCKTKSYIAAGDIFQANIAQRIELGFQNVHSFSLYKILQAINPAPFACYLDFGKIKVISSSPERLVKLEGHKVSTRPIAGTRPRFMNKQKDRQYIKELFLSSKEQAEHVMLLDLERNDLGRVCRYGTVSVSEFMIMENYSHVHHIVSNIEGILESNKNSLDLIAAVFPGGTITGAPKVRCMQIIEELEPVSRDIYTGSIGYINYNGDIDFNIVIRTFLVYKDKGYLQVGAGIVADSDPQKEYYETLYKGEALLEAWKIAKENGEYQIKV